MADFILRDVEADLWRQFKACAALNGKTMREVLLEMIQQYVRDTLGTKR